MSIVLQRIYDEASPMGGHRVLVDGIWPRGISKSTAQLDEWMKDLAPEKTLRQWFNHEPEKFDEFAQTYRRQLEEDEEQQRLLEKLRTLADGNRVVLLFGAKETHYNHAVVLKNILEEN
ncbi:DUF488 domain-containing protein [Thalassobacillus sp. CUG 92003]|uniref:DUF488 domain-containing protein n=1 Tax=Thalassobacillus sp. CUG 92003 TaxID=2736641 RepID=UPI0015E69714|nr:DUF488 family protein [Thalassobacillus sp. CUG 92003]